MTTSSLHAATRPRPSVVALATLGLATLAVIPLQGAGAASPAPPSVVVPLDPVRILDTRHAIGIATTSPIAAEQTITLQVTGTAAIPPEATGVVLNVTITGADGSGYVTASPTGAPRPTASVINYQAGDDVANMITATLGTGGAIDLYNAQAGAHLVADVAGYLLPAGNGGTPGPQGPTGPQGPAGPQGPPASEQDLTFYESIGRPTSPGSVNGRTFNHVGSVWPKLECRENTITMRFEVTTPTGTVAIHGQSQFAFPDLATIVRGPTVTGAGAFYILSATPDDLTTGTDTRWLNSQGVLVVDGVFLNYDLSLELSATQCIAVGKISPDPG